MDREILFKGKCKETKAWVYGDLIQSKSGRRFILPVEEPANTNYIEVIPKTVCQYIGIKDKANNKIFENQILRGKFGTGLGGKSTKYKEFNFTVTYHGHSPEFHLDMPKGYGPYRFLPHLTECMIIGNIFDHPQILQSL